MEDIAIIPRPRKILFIGYNYNSSYIMIGTDIGFQVHQTYPLALKFSRVLNGGISLVTNLNKSNIFGLVGGGESPKYAPNKLLLWDDKQGKEIYEFRFNSFVLNCFIKLKYIFDFCKDTINIISMKTMKTAETIITIDNPNGIGSISSSIDKYILCWPDLDKGKIAIKDFSELKSNSVVLSAISKDKNSIFKSKLSFQAHESEIVYLKLNNDGSKLATASKRGYIIRIFDTIKGCVIQELKRGSGDAKIYSINFSFDNNFVALTSDHGTAHIFVINKNIKEVSNVLSKSSNIIFEVDKNINNNIINENNINNTDKDNNKKKEKNKQSNLDDFDIIDSIDSEDEEEEKKNNKKNNNTQIKQISNIIEKDDNEDNKIIINNEIDNNNKYKEKDNGFEIINEDFTNSDVIEKQNYESQKSLLSSVSKMMGFSTIFQSEWSFASFKIPYRQQSFISFIQGDINNNKIIVIDKDGNYTVAEINSNKEAKIVKKDLLI